VRHRQGCEWRSRYHGEKSIDAILLRN